MRKSGVALLLVCCVATCHLTMPGSNTLLAIALVQATPCSCAVSAAQASLLYGPPKKGSQVWGAPYGLDDFLCDDGEFPHCASAEAPGSSCFQPSPQPTHSDRQHSLLTRDPYTEDVADEKIHVLDTTIRSMFPR